MAYVEFQLRVRNNAQVVATRGGAEAAGTFRLTQVQQDLIAVLDRWVRGNKITRREEMNALGSLLYEAIFDGDVAQLFNRSLDEIKSPDRLRLQLIFDREAFALASIPWEFLYRPDSTHSDGYFFATHPRLVLSRYMPLDEDPEDVQAVDGPLRFLVVVAKPKELGPVLETAVVEEIEKLCGESGFSFRKLDNPPIEDFVSQLEDYKPHILHFMGHGRYQQSEDRGELALLKPDRETVEWVTDATFATFFEIAKPRLVVLHACEGGQIDFTSKFAGLAPKLVRQYIPAVVAMQYEVSNKTAIKFSKKFYKLLAEREPIDGAVQQSRRQLTVGEPNAYSNRDFGTPVLYMRSHDGLIIPSIRSNG